MPSVNSSDQLKKTKDAVEKEITRLEKLKAIKGDLDKESEERLFYLRKSKEIELAQERKRLQEEVEEKLHEARLEQLKEEGKYSEQVAEQVKEKYKKSAVQVAGQITSSITGALDDSINNYVSQIQALSAHLSGTGRSLSGITDSLQNALSGQGLISQQSVFNNLASYVKSGITYNVEQRAFLKTIADDISLSFDTWTNSMNQLVRLQAQDSTSNRLALEYSLQEFLNENYKTSEYIVDSFSNISNSLLTAQSTMTATNAMQFEGIIQSWLGSMYSAGMNSDTVNSIASAINALGSGDISNLGSGISNLVLMGAARAGLDYGALLNNGLDASTTDKLLASIASYMQEMGSNQSNVVRSQLGNLFGVSITDLIASNNLRNTSSTVSTDISGLLSDYAGFTPFATKFNNFLDNVMFSWGTNIASNGLSYGSYQIEKIMANTLGTILDDVKVGGGILPFEVDLGNLAAVTPLITLLPTLVQTVVGDVIPSMFTSGGLAGIFNSLGTSLQGSTIKMSDVGVSGSSYFGGIGSTGDLLKGSMSSLNDLTSTSSIVESEDQGPTLEENVTTITDTVVSILDVLTERLESIDYAISDIARNPALTGWSSVTHFSV